MTAHELDPEKRASTSRELMVIPARKELNDVEQPALTVLERPQASFLAQLLASEERLGSYRRYRRAMPDAAAASYGGCLSVGGARTRFERSL